MQHETHAPPHSPLHNELRALSQEHHSPSSAAIHAALIISARTDVGYGETYTVIPRAESVHFATLAAQEMEARCPFLLDTIHQAMAANRKRISVEVLYATHNHHDSVPHLSAHARIAAIPRLVAWLMGHVQPAPTLQEPP